MYMWLAYPSKIKKDGMQIVNQTIKDGETYYWYDFIVTDNLIVNGKTLSCSFEINRNEAALTTPLAGRGSNGDYVGFELTYHKENIRSHTSDDVDKSDFYINKGDYEIIYQEDDGFFIPTNKSEMIIPKGETKPSFRCNITVLYNIAMSETEYYENAQQKLFDKTIKEIRTYMEDLNNYTFKSYPHVFLQDNPYLQIGQCITYKDTKGYALKTRVLKLSTNIDYDYIQEITVGNKAIKGTITQIKEDIQTIIANGDNGGDGLTGNQFNKLLAKYGTQYFLSKQYKDIAHATIAFEKGLTVGTHERGVSGAAIDGEGAAEVESIAVRRDVKVGDDAFVRADGSARLGDVEVDRVRSKGADEGDRNLISGRGFDLFMGADGKSHLWVDDANIRGKLVAMSTEIRKVSYSGGTLLLSNAGSTLSRVIPITDNKGAVVAYKCWAKADDGTTQTMNWWRIGMMALCQTFNVSGNTGGNRRYWRLVVGVGQERLDDGKIYDYVLLSNVARFAASTFNIPYYTSGRVLTAKGNVLRWAGEPVGMVQRMNNTAFILAYVLQEGGNAGDVDKIKDDDGALVMNRTLYGYEPTADAGAPDAPMAGDVMVQCGDQVRWQSRGNVIRLCTSSDDGDIDTTPSLSMYHGIGKLREVIVNGEATANKSVWQWRDLTALISPIRTYINSEYFYFFTGGEEGIAKAQSFSEFKMDSDNVAVSVKNMSTGLETAGVHIDGDKSCIVAKADTFKVVNKDGKETATVDEDGNLTAGSVHTVSKDNTMRVDVDNGMLTVSTANSNATIQLGIDEDGFPLLVFYNPDGSVGMVMSAKGSDTKPLVNPSAVLVLGDITGSFSYSKMEHPTSGKIVHTLLYNVKLTVQNNSGNYKTISDAVLSVSVKSAYDGKTVTLHSYDKKLMQNKETMEMTYTTTETQILSSTTFISIADKIDVTATNEGGRTWTTKINKTT